MNFPLVSIISINYNQSQVTLEMLASFENLSYPNYEIIIIDNASPNDSPEIIKKQYPKINLILSKKNLGFAGGNNLGVKQAKGKYILFLNNDTEVTKKFLEPLVEIFEKNKMLGMASPRLIYYFSDNIIQYAGANSINHYTGRGSKIGIGEKDIGQYNENRPTDLVHGAGLMVKTEAIKKLGMMPDIFFLYYEEHDWCEMFKRAGYQIYYVGKSKIYHKESISVGKNSPTKTYYMNRARILFMRRNTNFFQFIISFLFFTLFSIPKKTIFFILNKEWNLILPFYKAYFWNFYNFNVHKNPKL